MSDQVMNVEGRSNSTNLHDPKSAGNYETRARAADGENKKFDNDKDKRSKTLIMVCDSRLATENHTAEGCPKRICPGKCFTATVAKELIQGKPEQGSPERRSRGDLDFLGIGFSTIRRRYPHFCLRRWAVYRISEVWHFTLQ